MSTEPKDTAGPMVEGTGNVFADIGLEMTEEDMLKVHIALQINRTINKRGLTQAKAAEIMGIDQPKISKIIRGRLSGFSERRLIEYLLRLGRDIEVRFPERIVDRGQIRVRAC